MSPAMKLAFILDPLDQLKAYKDSSIAMMRAAARRGHQIFAIRREALIWEGGVVSARALALTPTDDDHAWYVAGEESVQALTAFDAVLMRQDPPFDFEYVTATWLLERAGQAGARIFNHPRSIRDHSEKLAITEFPQFAPATLVARAATDINAFIDAHGDTILKPLDGMGGSQIFRVRADDPNRNVIIETLTQDERRTIMAQAYLPAISGGDKRVLIIGGKVIPYSLARIPMAGETRGNLAAGGRGVAMPLTEGEHAIATHLAPILWARGLLIVGLDMIGDRLTEINVTSPTCMVEITAQMGFDVPGAVIDALEEACT
ncbi:MAG: glutathione synthase [Zoogloea sp.]|uniref:glutathione synthase n=1 Tax=Zoogloea sp. TaxID=49181 RepID=UPI002602C200|nr:glutathione synthase [Zoogloea sp.]MDD2989220.1 glutathione synthase [Zoogloea sp.]